MASTSTETQTSVQTLAVVGSWTQTQLLIAAWGLDSTMVHGGGTGHLDQYGPSDIRHMSRWPMALGHQYSLRRLTRPWAFIRFSMITGAMHIIKYLKGIFDSEVIFLWV